MDLHAIFDAPGSQAPPVTGKWAALQVQPDVGTGEILNIGVIFAPARGPLVFRLLPSARVFGVLFGQQGADNIAFLLRVLHERLSSVRKRADIPNVSPQVALSPWKYAAGHHPDEIVARLYASVVTLARAEADRAVPIAEHSVIRTQDLRDHVRRQLPEPMRGIIRSLPVQLSDPEGKLHSIEMPIWHAPDDMFPQLRFGTLISLQYRNAIYRKAELGPASQYFSTALASQHAASGARALFLALRPPDNAPGFTAHDITEIEDEFDSLTWGFQKRTNVDVRMVHHLDEAAHAVRALFN